MHFKGPDLVEYHVPLPNPKPSVPGDAFEHFYLIPFQHPEHMTLITDLIRAQPSRDKHQCLQRPWAHFLSTLRCPGRSLKVVPSESITRQHSCCLFPTRLVCDKTSVIEVLVLAPPQWQGETQEFCPGAKVVLVGCKLDMRTDLSVMRELAKHRLIPVTHEQVRSTNPEQAFA